MPLFDLPTRTNSKANDMKLAKQSNSTRKAVPTVRGGNSLLDRITQAQKLVETHLGKFKDDYILIQDEATLMDYIYSCEDNSVISIDTETTGLDPLQDEIAGICIYTPNRPGAYIPINHVSYITNMPIPNQLSIDVIRHWFNDLIDKEVDIIMFNAKFDIRFLRNRVGLKDIYCTWDCYLAQRLLNENEPTNALKKLHQKYVLNGQEDAFTYEEFFKGIPFTMIPLNVAVLYAAHDPVITYELYEYQRKYLKADSDREDMRNLYWVFKNIEMPCVSVVADMEDNGILFDLTYNQVLSERYNNILKDKLNAFYERLSEYDDKIIAYRLKHADCKLDNPINIASPTQLAILFYDILGYDVIDKKSPRGTGVEILSKMDSPLAQTILEYREVEKLISTYIDKLPNCVNPKDGRIHCSFNQYGANTGRMSSSDPNLQNIPSHNKDIRKMFIASNEISEVSELNNSFVVDQWSEVNTVDGWKFADKIVVGDKLVVEENNMQFEIIVSRIDRLVDKNQIIYYY